MLAKRVIPVFLQRGNSLVKGKQFNSWRTVGHVRQAVKIYQSRGVDELIYLDIAATPEGRGPDFDMVRNLADECFMPITIGGGVRSVEDVRRLLEAGADKVSICNHAVEHPEFISESAKIFGSQAIVIAIDAIEIRSATQWAKEVSNRGAGEILLTSVERDGMMEGYDLDLIKSVSQAVNIPVVAAGGCGTPEHMNQAIKAGASAVASGAMFAFTDVTPRIAAKYLAEQGIEIRQ